MLKKLMRPISLVAVAVAGAALVSGCYAPPHYHGGHHMPPFQPPVGQPWAPPGYNPPPVFTEFGQVVNIEIFEGQTSGQGATGAGAVAGGLIGGVLGNQVGGGRGRTAATAAGVVGGAVAGNAIENRMGGSRPFRVARITVQTDTAQFRVFDVPDPGGLQIGQRVRIHGGQLFPA